MATDVQVSCIRKRGDHLNPHERIQGLGGVHGGQQWYMPEEDIIAELKKAAISRQWNFYTLVDRKRADVIVGSREGIAYLRTTADDSKRDNLLSLLDCPA
jgi:hypothetical protein